MATAGRTSEHVDNHEHSSRTDVAVLGELAAGASVESAVAAVRSFLDMEVAYATRMDETIQHLETVDGDAASFGLHQGLEIPVGDTYCHRVLAGRLPNLIQDVRGDDRAASLAITEKADVGAFVSVPLTFSDGRRYGTLCAGAHDARPGLGYRDLQFLRVFARVVADQLEREELQQTAHDLELQATAASALLTAVQARDSYTAEHSHAVVDQAVRVARHLGLDEDGVVDVRNVALLHDIGKIAVPDAILTKEGPLDDAEWEVMRKHPISSQTMIRQVPGLERLGPMMRAEHERWDGTGYPDGLSGEQIPLASRITLVCDAYHAMTSDRPYRAAMSPAEALREIAENAGSQFCPVSARALLETMASEPGSPATPG